MTSGKIPVVIHSRTQLLTGIFLLLLGSLVYVVDRSPDQIYFTRYFGIHLKLFVADTQVLGSLGLRLPINPLSKKDIVLHGGGGVVLLRIEELHHVG